MVTTVIRDSDMPPCPMLEFGVWRDAGWANLFRLPSHRRRHAGQDRSRGAPGKRCRYGGTGLCVDQHERELGRDDSEPFWARTMAMLTHMCFLRWF